MSCDLDMQGMMSPGKFGIQIGTSRTVDPTHQAPDSGATNSTGRAFLESQAGSMNKLSARNSDLEILCWSAPTAAQNLWLDDTVLR